MVYIDTIGTFYDILIPRQCVDFDRITLHDSAGNSFYVQFWPRKNIEGQYWSVKLMIPDQTNIKNGEYKMRLWNGEQVAQTELVVLGTYAPAPAANDTEINIIAYER